MQESMFAYSVVERISEYLKCQFDEHPYWAVPVGTPHASSGGQNLALLVAPRSPQSPGYSHLRSSLPQQEFLAHPSEGGLQRGPQPASGHKRAHVCIPLRAIQRGRVSGGKTQQKVKWERYG